MTEKQLKKKQNLENMIKDLESKIEKLETQKKLYELTLASLNAE